MNSGRRAVSGQACHSTAVAERRSPTPIWVLATRILVVGAGAGAAATVSIGITVVGWRRGLAGEPGGGAGGERARQPPARGGTAARRAASAAFLDAAEIAVLDAGHHRLQGFGAKPVHAAPLVLAAIGHAAVIGGRRVGGGIDLVAGRRLRARSHAGEQFFRYAEAPDPLSAACPSGCAGRIRRPDLGSAQE